MSLTTQKASIKSILEAVSGIGVVHDYQRFSSDWNKFLSLFKINGKINGCMFSREKSATQQRTQGETEKANVYVIRCIMVLNDDDATEKTFDLLLEAIQDALRTPSALNSGDLTTSPDWGPMAGAVGAQLEISEPRMFGNVLCHYAELRFCVCEDETT